MNYKCKKCGDEYYHRAKPHKYGLCKDCIILKRYRDKPKNPMEKKEFICEECNDIYTRVFEKSYSGLCDRCVHLKAQRLRTIKRKKNHECGQCGAKLKKVNGIYPYKCNKCLRKGSIWRKEYRRRKREEKWIRGYKKSKDLK